MVPDIALRLQSMERALTEVIIPAIPPEGRMAREQAHLVVAFLRIIAQQHEHAYRYELAELREFAPLLRALIAVADGGQTSRERIESARATLARAEPIATLDVPEQHELVSMVRELRSAADTLVRAAEEDGQPAVRDAVTRLVMAQSAKEIARGRSWTAAAGLDQDKASIPPLKDVLAASPGFPESSAGI